ncbi:hypothetical protein [Streptomyces sp. NPDC088762]|uniref:hypothetical protein n=1 Tax=Streptomyces sp. NPDC088762 TaxID=3365891 RepID=UPI003829049B
MRTGHCLVQPGAARLRDPGARGGGRSPERAGAAVPLRETRLADAARTTRALRGAAMR